MQGIYCIKNTINGKIYVGSSVNIKKKFRNHLLSLRKNQHPNFKLQSSFNKHKEESFIFYVLEDVLEKENLIAREQFHIDTLAPVYNICLLADSSLGVKRTEKTIEKVRQANLGLKHPEWRNKIKSIAQGGENHWTKKKNFSEEAKQKMSTTHKKLYENGYVNPTKKSILQYDLEMNLLNEWESGAAASRGTGLSTSTICQCLSQRSKTSGGFIWKYKI
jgi:group I intron endonuclease